MKIRNVTIIGAGLMGNGLAQVFAQDEDARVIMRDVIKKSDPMAEIRANLNQLIEKKAMTEGAAGSILSRVSFTNDLDEAVKDADLIVECIPEIMELKQNLLQEIEQLCKTNCILATNTSVMSITEIASKCQDKSRIVGTHFWNPPYLIPLVEVVKGDETSNETMEAVYDHLKKIGKRPVKCMKDIPGFIANRLQHAVWREALSMVEHGIADAQTVDEALRYGPGLRWPVLGVLENADMIGLDLTLNIHSYILKYLEDAHEPSKLLQELVAKGDLGFKTGQGYQKWTAEEIASSNRRLRDYLIEVTKDLK
ncbi:3-hydroxyacyl-CoA dehydrogenase family protein [Dehalobacter sp. DCM]|uniref:3-hydroxyacyl-CoA dehydrogenase family protein n=1 Tax=Dehalobacter sp. DCM TaxID=2907827 RepID=UPI003081F5D7